MDTMSLNDVICADGGRMIELYKQEGRGQITLREIWPGITVGGHKHPKTNEKWWVLCGDASVRLEYPDGVRVMHTIEGGAERIIDVPAGTGHEIANKGDGNVWLVFHADKVYDSENPDKEAWSWTSPS